MKQALLCQLAVAPTMTGGRLAPPLEGTEACDPLHCRPRMGSRMGIVLQQLWSGSSRWMEITGWRGIAAKFAIFAGHEQPLSFQAPVGRLVR